MSAGLEYLQRSVDVHKKDEHQDQICQVFHGDACFQNFKDTHERFILYLEKSTSVKRKDKVEIKSILSKTGQECYQLQNPTLESNRAIQKTDQAIQASTTNYAKYVRKNIVKIP